MDLQALLRRREEMLEPVLDPLRRVLPRVGMIDITPMVAIIVILAIMTVLRESQAS